MLRSAFDTISSFGLKASIPAGTSIPIPQRKTLVYSNLNQELTSLTDSKPQGWVPSRTSGLHLELPSLAGVQRDLLTPEGSGT